MIKYFLNFSKLRKKTVDGIDDVVYQVEYFCNAQSEEYSHCSYSLSGFIEFEVDEIDEDNFIPFEEVTKETLISWILENKGVETIEELSFVTYAMEQVEKQIEDLLMEKEVKLFDWNFTNNPSEE